MKVAFITTVGHNVGDDFVRDGIAHLLSQACGPLSVRLVHKHFPVTARPGAERLHLQPVIRVLRRLRGFRGDRLSRWLDARPLPRHGDAVMDCDLLVQCGAPVYWLNASHASQDNEWYGPLVQRRWRRREPRPPLLNLAAGACQPFDSDGSEFATAPATQAFIRTFFAECALTTVRDELSSRILAGAGLEVPRLPCTSLFARHWHGIAAAPAEFVALNFMPRGGHYDFEDLGDCTAWRVEFSKVLETLRRTERCVIVCHDREEEAFAFREFPQVERFFSTEHADYLRFYARARCGVFNRVHGAFALASFGRPAVIVGADSRARMGDVIGLPVLPVHGVTVAAILAALSRIRGEEPAFAGRSAALSTVAEKRYLELLRDVLPGPRS